MFGASSSKVNQNDIRVFAHSIEHNLFAIGGHIEGLRSTSVVQAAQSARLVRFQVEQPEVLCRKRSLRVHESQATRKESITLSLDTKSDRRQIDSRSIRSNGQQRRIDADVGTGVHDQVC